jgi:hypothetical protein
MKSKRKIFPGYVPVVFLSIVAETYVDLEIFPYDLLHVRVSYYSTGRTVCVLLLLNLNHAHSLVRPQNLNSSLNTGKLKQHNSNVLIAVLSRTVLLHSYYGCIFIYYY